MKPARITVLGPSPILTVTVESRPDLSSDEVHFHAGGQGVWVARMAGELGAEPVLCGLSGGEVGRILEPLLAALPCRTRIVPAQASSGCYVTDRRWGERQPFATAWSLPPSRHELDDLFSVTVAAALASDVLVVCNPLPGDALPARFYRNLVADVVSNGTQVLVDLSSPRLDAALAGNPTMVKLNDWELAEYVTGPVGTPEERGAAIDRLRSAGAGSVVVTRGGESAFAVLADGASYELQPPTLIGGSSEGCGDAMMGGIAAARGRGDAWLDSLVYGMAAGAANFLRQGLGTGLRAVTDELAGRVKVHEVLAPGV